MNISGLGLGLYLSKQIIEHLGGTINCKSEKGVGSQFNISIKAHAFIKSQTGSLNKIRSSSASFEKKNSRRKTNNLHLKKSDTLYQIPVDSATILAPYDFGQINHKDNIGLDRQKLRNKNFVEEIKEEMEEVKNQYIKRSTTYFNMLNVCDMKDVSLLPQFSGWS